MANATTYTGYDAKVIRPDADTLVVRSGGKIIIQEGAAIVGPSEVQTVAIADLTDNSGGATADGTIGVVTAPSALTDSTGGSASTTLAAITTFTPSVAWNGSSVYPSAADATAIAAAITSEKNSIASLAARQAEDRTAIIALTDAIKELSAKVNLILAAQRLAGVIAT